MAVIIPKQTTPSNADAGYVKLYVNSSGNWESIDESGVIKTYAEGVTPEQVQDIVGAMFIDSSTIDVTYNDAGNVISMTVIQTAIDHTNLQNKGSNTHAQIDSHIASTGNPHATTAAQVGADPSGTASAAVAAHVALADPHSQYATDVALTSGLSGKENTGVAASLISAHESALDPHSQYATDAALTSGLAGKENTITAGTTSQYYRGDKTFQTLNKGAVGLGNVDNTSDADKIVSTATQTALNLKENTISSGTTSQYWRGDKTFQTLDKSTVGLNNADNTSDTNKPISTATQVALNAKYDATNPNNYETPTQLNARDTANRSRANHSGTQLASTISDFASAVRATVLTGISFATNAAILATDSLLVALGKIQAQIDGHFGSGGTAHADATTSVSGFMSALDKTKLDGIISDVISFVTVGLTNTSNSTFVTVNQLAIPVVAGNRYKFEAYLLFDSNAINTGIGLSIGGTATGTLRAIAEAPVSNTAGTANKFSGPINALNGVVTTSAVGATGTQYRAQLEGVFTATTSGLIYPQFRSETNGTQVRVNIDSNMVYKEY